MRIISWNLNGVRSMSSKLKNGEKKGSPTTNGIKTLIQEYKPDVLCFQEVKTQSANDLAFLKTDYKYILTNFAKYKKGYSGVALLSNERPQWVSYDFTMYSEEQIGPYNKYEFIDEGRVITARFKNCVIVTAYVPNSQPELARIDDRIEWESIMRNYISLLRKENTVPVILCGDLNVAPTKQDIHNPYGKNKTPGFSPEERTEFQKMLDCGFVDSFRLLNPDTIKYSYFSNFGNARENNKGWRIDLMLVSEQDKEKIVAADCLTDFCGSDHSPVLLDLA